MAKIKQAIEDFVPDVRLVDERGPTPQQNKKMRQTPINGALSRKQITRQQGVAAEKFYNHWYRAGHAGKCGSIDLDRVFASNSDLTLTDSQLFHKQSYERAVKTLGMNRSRWVELVVCYEASFEEAGQKMGWNNRPQAVAVGVQIIRDALAELCDLWGII